MSSRIIKGLRDLASETIDSLPYELMNDAADRIEALEAGLRELSDAQGWMCCSVSQCMKDIAREALEGEQDE